MGEREQIQKGGWPSPKRSQLKENTTGAHKPLAHPNHPANLNRVLTSCAQLYLHQDVKARLGLESWGLSGLLLESNSTCLSLRPRPREWDPPHPCSAESFLKPLLVR